MIGPNAAGHPPGNCTLLVSDGRNVNLQTRLQVWEWLSPSNYTQQMTDNMFQELATEAPVPLCDSSAH